MRVKSWLELCNEADRNAVPVGEQALVRNDAYPVYPFSGVGSQNTFYEVGSGYDVPENPAHRHIKRLFKP